MGRNKELNGIKGLTAKDRKKWEKDIIKNNIVSESQWSALDDEKKTEYFFNTQFKNKFSERPDYNSISELSYEDAVSFWNANYDMEETATDFSVEHNGAKTSFDTQTSYNPETGNLVSSMSDIFGNQLSESRRKSIDESGASVKQLFGSYAFNTAELFDSVPVKLFNEENYKNDPMYYTQVDEYSKELKNIFDNSNESSYKAFKKFDDVANRVSNTYRLYKNSDRLGLTAGDIKDIMSYYYAICDLSGEQDANLFLDDYMRNRISKRQSISEKWWEGFKGMGAAAMSAGVQLYGFLDAVASGDAFDESTYNENISGWSNFWDKAINNEITRYGKDIMTYQAYRKEDINRLKREGLTGGLLFKTVEEERGDLSDMIFTANFLPSMIQQHGFTIASSMVSFGSAALAKAAGWVFKAPTKVVGKIFKGEKALARLSKYRQLVDKASHWIGGFAGAGFAGTGESISNALDTRETILEEGDRKIQEGYENWASPIREKAIKSLEERLMQESYQRMNSENPMTQEELETRFRAEAMSIESSLQAQYKQANADLYEQLEKEAIQAQNTNFAFNQAITGFLNATLKNTIMHPSVRKIFGKLDDTSIYKIAKDGKWYQKAWFYGKRMFSEAFGEGGEEAVTEITDAISRGWHGADFDHYLENGTDSVGWEGFKSSVGAASIGALESLVSKETAYAFISGALSSGISTMNINGVYDTYQAFKNDDASALDKAKALSSIFFRSSIVEGYRSAKTELDEAKMVLKSHEDFASDPKNASTHTSVITMANFMAQKNASVKSEMDFRSSHLGMTVAEINALERIKDTHPAYYAKVMDELDAMATLDENTEYGKERIEEYKHSGIADVSEQTDEEIAETIRKNAKEFKKFRERVAKKKEANQRYYGKDIDIDVLDALTYGDIAYEDNLGRVKSMSSEVEEAFNEGIEGITLHEDSNISKQQKEHIVRYGTVDGISKQIKSVEKEISDAEIKIESLSRSKKEARKNKDKIAKLKESIKQKQKLLKDLTKESESINFEDGANTTLSEKDIMALSNADRAKVLSQDFYNNTTDEQRAVIDNLKSILKAGDSKLSSREDNPVLGDSATKISDIAELENSQKLHREIRNLSPEDLTRRGKTIKFNALKRKSEERIKDVGDIEDYDTFEKTLTSLLENPSTSFMDRINAERLLKDNANYKRLKAKSKRKKDYEDALKRAFIREKLTDKSEIIGNIIIGQALADKEIDSTNTDAIAEALLGENPIIDLDSYYAKFSEGRKDLPQITFDESMIKRFIERIKSIKEIDSEIEDVQKPIVPDATSQNEPPVKSPEVHIDPEVKEQAEEEIKKIKEVILETEDVDKFIEDSISSIFKNLNTNQQKNKFTNMLVILAASKNKDAATQLLYKKVFNEMILHDLGSLDLKTQQEIVEKISEGNAEIASKLYNIITEFSRIDNSDFKRDNSGRIMYNGIDITSDFNKITTLVSQAIRGTEFTDYQNFVISDILGDSDNETLIEINSKHNIDGYLKTHTNNPKTEVRFVPAFDLSVFASDSSFPIYMVVEDAEGTIEIEGKKYQVIGVSAAQSLGIANSIQQRAKVIADISMSEEDFPWQFVTDEVTNTPIVFKGFRIKSNTPKHVQKYEGNGTKVSVMLDNEGMSVETFISRMAHGHITTDESNVTTVSYTSPYGDRATVTPKPTPSQKGKNRQYISYVEQNGKDPEKDTNTHGESEIELFIDEIKDMLLPNDKSFIEIINSDSNDIYNSNVVGYVIATYAQTLLNYTTETIKEFSNSDFISNHIKVSSSGLKFVGLSEFDDELNKLNNALRRLLYIKDYTFKVKPIQQNNGEITITLELSFGDSVIQSLNIGVYKANENGDIIFEGISNIDKAVHSFMSDFMLNDDKTDMRRITKDPLVKYQIDYQDIEDARMGISLTEKPTTMPELSYWVAYKKIEEAIRRGILRTSKASLGRQGYRVEVNNTATPTTTKQPEVFTNGKQEESIPKPLEVVKSAFEKALDKLVEAYKAWDKKRKEGTLDEGVIRVTARNYNSGNKINDIVAAVGNIYDSAIRDVINEGATADDLSSRYTNLSKEEAQKIVDAIEGIKEHLKLFPGNWKLDARSFLLSGQLVEKRGGVVTEDGKKGKTELVTGSPDIVAYNDKGLVIIIDVKTYASSTLKLVEQSKVSWKGQTDDYKSLMESSTGAQVIGTYILPIKVYYSKNASVTEDGTILEGAFPTQLNGEFNTLGDTLLLPLTTTEEESLSELEKEQSQQCGNKTGNTPSPKKGDGPPPMPDLTDFS
jgi:hypothetical protein